MVAYRLGNDLDLDAFIRVYERCSLGARRPVGDRNRMRQMLEQANLVVSAWDGARMIGVARSLTDFAFATYLADLAVDEDYQRRGIGRELVRQTQLAGGKATVFLFAAPEAEHYYQRIGFAAGSGWLLGASSSLR